MDIHLLINNLKQQPFTHFISIGSIFIVGQTIIFCLMFTIMNYMRNGGLILLFIYLSAITIFYIIYNIICLIIGLIQHYTQTKIKNKFFLQNKTYNIIWWIGNYIFIISIILIIVSFFLLSFYLIQ